MESYEQELSKELAYYNKVLEVIHHQLKEAKNDNSKSVQALRNMNREMWETASHSVEDFDNASDLSLFYQPQWSTITAVESTAEKIRLLELLLEKAYFARIDFCEEGEHSYDAIYIGRGTLMEDTDSKCYIYDWRSPVASLFYQFETGKAFYDAPCGRITGHMSLKRQYEIKKGILEYFFEADVEISDEFLRKMLSGNTSNKMKTIVETIQKDQDSAIRDINHDLLMIQGIAGSGKTSIALHRVAYLKYQGLSNRLKSSDIIILSPNTLFEQYISNVLPELGEEEVKSILFDGLIENLLPKGTLFESRYRQMERLISNPDEVRKNLEKEVIAFKASDVFIEILNRYVRTIPTYHIHFTDVNYDDQVIFSSRDLKKRLLQMDDSMKLTFKLTYLRKQIFERIHELRQERMPKLIEIAREDKEHPFDWEAYARALSIEESTQLALQIDDFTKLNSIVLYKKLFFTEGLLLSLGENLNLPENITEILHYSQRMLSDFMLQNEDALAIAYLQIMLGENSNYKEVRQVIIDEAQDYDSIHFEVLKYLFPHARYTVLGDINQTIEKQETMDLYERITKIIQPKAACLMSMNKSFRCTKEILSFSRQFLERDTTCESFNRNGDEPQIIGAINQGALDKKIMEEAIYSQSMGYQSIGIICKNFFESERLYLRLKDKMNMNLVGAESSLNTMGVFVIPIAMSKGLEFDSVLVYDVDETHYYSQDDKKLLYIASTRALHRLNLFHVGKKSPLLQGGSYDIK